MSQPTTNPAPLSLEQAVARFIFQFDTPQIDAASRTSAMNLIKDQIAIQVGASQLPWSQKVLAFRQPRPGRSSVVLGDQLAAAADAAYLNATYGHGFEYDDFAGNAHPGCCVVPTALAIAEEVNASFEEMLVAMLAGYEAYVRIGQLGSPDLLHAGWQPHSVLANFGAAAVAAKLYRLDEQQTLHALAIALSHASGTTEYASTGGSIKRVHAGMAVRNGIESAQLAQVGITGPLKFLTGRRGLYATFIRKPVTDEAADLFALDAPMLINQLSFKAYCCCAANHAYIELMARIQSKASQVAGVQVRVQSMTDAIVGNQNLHIYAPRNIEELQYSLPMQMAFSALGMGNGYQTHRDFLEGRIDIRANSPVHRFANAIVLEVDEELDRGYPGRFVAQATVRYLDGSSEELFQERAKGSPLIPFSDQDIWEKFIELTSSVIGARRAQALYDFIDQLQPHTPVHALGQLLREPAYQGVAHAME